MLNLCTAPYNRELPYFYFKDLAEYDTKLAAHKKIDHDYEHEIMFIDGDSDHEIVFKNVDCCNISQCFDLLETFEAFSDSRKLAIDFLMSNYQETLIDAMANSEDVTVYEGRIEDMIEDYCDDLGLLCDTPDHIKVYFDYKRYARDLEIDGDLKEHNGNTFSNFN